MQKNDQAHESLYMQQHAAATYVTFYEAERNRKGWAIVQSKPGTQRMDHLMQQQWM